MLFPSVNPAHPTFVSADAASQSKNIFVWCTKRTYITLSWRVDENLKMTVKDMYRWLDIVIVEDETGALVPTRLDYALFPVIVEPNEYWVLQYTIRREATNALDCDSRERLCPGNYGIYRRDGSKQDTYMFLPKNTFSEGHAGVVSDFPDLPALEPTTELQDAAFAQTETCPFTGAEFSLRDRDENMAVTWILPPYSRYLLFRRFEAYFERSRLANQVYKKPKSMDPCMILSNCLVTTLEIIDLFWENKVAVDVDNGYKIVYFDQRTPNTPNFQERFRMVHPDRDRDVFLRAHFNYSLLVNIIGGDVRDDFRYDEPDTFADMMDLYGDPIDLSGDLAEEWGTPIGRKVREWLLAHQ